MLVIPGGEIAGAPVMRDLVDLPEVSLYAFHAYRCVTMWAQVREEEDDDGEELFDREAMEQWVMELAGGDTAAPRDDLRAFLAAIGIELVSTPPDRLRMARACLGVSEWAMAHNRLPTALCFVEAAAWALPTARYAFLCGKLQRQYGQHHQAERWLKEAEDRARREKDWETRARVMLARGSVDLARGSFGGARADFQRALRMCGVHRLSGAVLGEVHHDLLTVAIAQREHDQAQEHAEQAMKAYPRDHPRLPHLAHDVAGLWMDLGDYANALAVLLPLLDREFASDPVSRLMVCASAIRAAGGSADRTAYGRMGAELEKALLQAGEPTIRHAPALLDAARGALLVEDWPRADAWTDRARELGGRMQQDDVLAEADRLVAARPSGGAARASRNRQLAAQAVAALAAGD
jgi:tetratricopeptide (TPR) repeat protein